VKDVNSTRVGRLHRAHGVVMTGTPAPLRVLVADDHPPTRAGVQYALEADGCQVIAAVANAKAAVEAAAEHRPDVCLLDIHMPGNGISAAAEIGRLVPDSAIVMLTASRDDDDLFEALRSGASGYLLKDMDPDRLAPALRGVIAGEAALPRTLALKVMAEFRTRSRRRLGRAGHPLTARLTSRESEVLDLLVQGLPTEEIAVRLEIGRVTVRTHVASILKKLQVKDRESAVRLAQSGSD
jgi:two-component system, NarL family, nitrate/nitrite response regulator NarL